MLEVIGAVAVLRIAEVGVVLTPETTPARNARPSLLARMTYSPLCFPDTLTEQELSDILETYELRPPTLFADDDRFFTDFLVWTGDVSIGSSNQAVGAALTYSFPADGTTWGLSAISSTGPNDLNARLTTLFGAQNLDRGREYFRQALGGWAAYTGLSYREVADDNAAMSSSSTRVASRGDIRMGGRPFGTGVFLAYNAFPSSSGLAGVGGGDMCMNTSFFIGSNFNSATNNYRYLRNTIAHEHGHGTGNIHTTPCNGTKLMEPFINTGFDQLSVDDLRGGARNYGDRYAGNGSFATARYLGDLVTPQIRSIAELFLSTNGSTGPNNTNQDWFTFSLASSGPVTVRVTPVGGNYQNGQQTSNCNPTSPPFVNASEAGNLGVELRNSAGNVILFTANSQPAGVAEVINAGTLAAGTYTVRVFDNGPNANQIVQLYDLRIEIGVAASSPMAFGGIDKRIGAGLSCWFMGNVTSRATQPGASISQYDWDIDGDGVYDILNNASPSYIYVSNGVYPVTLRVLDSNGLTATHTFNVTVFGATTTVTAALPSSGEQGQVVPITLTGTNLKNATNLAHYSISGSGVTITGTPVPNALGTSVTGLSLNITPGAAVGPRNITVSNADGNGTGTSVFTIDAAPLEPDPFSQLMPANGTTTASTAPQLTWQSSGGATTYSLVIDEDSNDDGTPDSNVLIQPGIVGTSFNIAPGTLVYKRTYTWSVTATNPQGNTVASNAPNSFRTPVCLGDANYDGVIDFNDITAILSNWSNGYLAGLSGLGDANNDSFVDFNDITAVLAVWGTSCP